MTVTYWEILGLRYSFIEKFDLQHRSIMDCVAPYTAVRLRIEVTL